MGKEILSNKIGRLKQDDRFPNWWKSEALEIPYFGNDKLTITLLDFEPEKDKTFLYEAEQALMNFIKLNIDDRNSISELAYKTCLDFFAATGFDEEAVKMFQEVENPQPWHLKTIELGKLLKLQNINDVWEFIHPTEIYVARRPYKDQDMYIQVACECDWEEEHGLQLVFRQGKKLTRISDQDGHLTEADAYDKPDEEDELLSKF